MSRTAIVDKSVEPTFIGPTEPPSASVGETWCDTSNVTNVLKVYDSGSSWVALGNYPGVGGATTAVDEEREKRNIWTFLQDGTPAVPDTFEGALWYAPTSGNAKMYNGSSWVPFVITDA